MMMRCNRVAQLQVIIYHEELEISFPGKKLEIIAVA